MKICIFEDFSVLNLSPLNYLRHTSEIICGGLTLKEKIEHSLKGKTDIYIHCWKELEDYCKELYGNDKVNLLENNDYLFLNSRVIFDKILLNNLFNENNTAYLSGEVVLAFTISAEKTMSLNKKMSSEDNILSIRDVHELNLHIKNIPSENTEYKIINYPSDLILYNEEELHKDLKQLLKKTKSKKGIYIAPKSKIHKSAVLDSSTGGIYIGKGTVIEPFTYIKGPCYIGEQSLIRAGAAIYGPVRIGDHCKISGEITSSIIHSYVNKQHLGFLGHSYLCEWINLVAGTTTSNLKNNYSEISINTGGSQVKTGSKFIGSFIGDHTKTGIQTMLNTGSMIGISCNLYGAGYHNNFVKSFTWDNSSNGSSIPYLPDKAVITARTTMLRRNVKMSEPYERLFRHFYNIRDKIPV